MKIQRYERLEVVTFSSLHDTTATILRAFIAAWLLTSLDYLCGLTSFYFKGHI